MPARKRVVQIERRRQNSRRWCGLSVKDVLQFLSILILPLMLGVFTVVITVQQQKLARQQRIEDMQLARQQRVEDKTEMRLQREQDRNESQLLREQDQNELQLQRAQDRNESQLQRDQAWNIAQTAQGAQNKITRDRYQDEILVAYIKETGDLLKKNNGSLTTDTIVHTFARAKTLNTIRQLDGFRQLHILRFLNEAGQLTNTNGYSALDISTAELTEIDFRRSGQLLTDGKTSLAGVYLVNSTFSNMSLEDVIFSAAELTNVNFSSTELFGVDFSSAQLKNVNFSSARLSNVIFSSAELKDINFSSARLFHVNFPFVPLVDVNFVSAELKNVDFSFAELKNVNFSSARLINVNFSSASLEYINFSSTELVDVNFSSTRIDSSNFSSATFPSLVGKTYFEQAIVRNTVFDKCFFNNVDFRFANLKGSTFRSAIIFIGDFSYANLQDADFSNTIIGDIQLQSPVSIRNAKLPNGTLGLGRNLVRNGDADCNIPLIDHWRIHNGSIAVTSSSNDQNQCQFSLQSAANGATMSQRINLVDIWDSSFWENTDVELHAQISGDVSVELISESSHGKLFNKGFRNSTNTKIYTRLWSGTEVVEVVVKFNAQQNQSGMRSSWCDNIQLFLNYDTL